MLREFENTLFSENQGRKQRWVDNVEEYASEIRPRALRSVNGKSTDPRAYKDERQLRRNVLEAYSFLKHEMTEAEAESKMAPYGVDQNAEAWQKDLKNINAAFVRPFLLYLLRIAL